MNSQLQIRNELLSHALSVINSHSPDIGVTYDNDKSFDPSAYDIYAACFYIPVVNEQVGKIGSPDEDEGIYQISVYVKSQSGNYDIDQLELIDAIRSGFRNATLAGISIDDINVNGGRTVDSWFVRDVSIGWYVLS